MTATVATVAYLGLDARAAEVQGQLPSSPPKITIVDLATKRSPKAASESARRSLRLASRFGRRFHRVLRVARTVADLAAAEQVGRIHVAEAFSYRRQAPRN